MLSTPTSVDVPLQTDDLGVIRVSGTRVTLHTLISTYLLGETLEAIHEGFPTVPLADIYLIIAYYLSNRSEVDAYMQQINEAAARDRQRHEATNPPPSKAELLARLDAQQEDF